MLHTTKNQEAITNETKTEIDNTNVTSNAESVCGLMQIALIRVFGNNGSKEDVLAACNTGSTQTWVDEEVFEKLDLEGREVSFNVTRIHGTQLQTSKTVDAKLGQANSSSSIAGTFTIFSQRNLEVGKSVNDVTTMKTQHPYLKWVSFKSIDLKVVKIILGQNAYELIRPLECRSGGANKTWAVRLPLGWTVSGPVTISDLRSGGATCHVAS